MPKYVTLDWNEYQRLEAERKEAVEKAREFGWIRSELLNLVLTSEDEKKYYEFLGPLPPIGWVPISMEEVIKRVKEKYGK